MLAADGYCKLVDFGLSKRRNQSVTLCGTPEYLAPEVIQNYWHSFELDFWGLGVLCFEMVFGAPPFGSYQGTKPMECAILLFLCFLKVFVRFEVR